MKKQKIVFLTGAGISVESGMSTFRGKNGLYANENIEYLVSHECLVGETQRCFDFINEWKSKLLDIVPNEAHKAISQLEKYYDVVVVTQNVDNLHERAGSTNIVHLHGEMTKACSMSNMHDARYIEELPLDTPYKIGDKAKDGSQLRPYIVLFGESVPMMEKAIGEAMEADIFVVVGTSLVVYPAGNLIHYVKPSSKKFVVDPSPMPQCNQLGFKHLQTTATEGMTQLTEILLKEIEE